MRIGYLEDEQHQAELVKSWLLGEGFDVFHAGTGKDFLEQLGKHPADILILDWQLPDMEGVGVLEAVRKQLNMKIPVIFATQRDSETDIVNALQLGADDYLVKPLRKAELLARLTALARRAGVQTGETVLELGAIQVDTEAEVIKVDGEVVKLTPKDYQLACCLLRNVGKLLSREYLLKEVWGIDAALNTRTVDVHVSRIRRSLKIGPETGYCIKTVYQHGYRLDRIESFSEA
ncbi:response regulator transcription factor [bacterium]|nr:response regulator transcription factor [bacterium]